MSAPTATAATTTQNCSCPFAKLPVIGHWFCRSVEDQTERQCPLTKLFNSTVGKVPYLKDLNKWQWCVLGAGVAWAAKGLTRRMEGALACVAVVVLARVWDWWQTSSEGNSSDSAPAPSTPSTQPAETTGTTGTAETE